MRASLQSRLAHVGKKETRWKFECAVCDVRGLPEHVTRAVVVWDRGRKAMMTPAAEVHGGYARWDVQLTQNVTIFRSTKTNRPDAKLCRLQVYDADKMRVGQLSSRAGLLAGIQIDLAQYTLPGDFISEGGKIAQLTLQSEVGTASLTPGGAQSVVLLQVNLRGGVSTGDDHDHNDDDTSSLRSGLSGMSGSSNTFASRDATHKLATHGEDDDASTVYDDDRPMRKGIEVEGSLVGAVPAWARRGGGKALAEAQTRVATLEQHLSTAQAQVQSLESTIGILRHRLDVEVLEDIGTCLERGKNARVADAARMYAQQLVEVSERLEALIVEDGPSETGGADADREMIILRRELAFEKVKLAEVSNERDEYRHLMKKLGVQSAGLAGGMSAASGGNRGGSKFGSLNLGLGSVLGA
mmetsp:Transcript_35290/g.88017  ORF Transcript_35290/g.88017 Transcript_35290/m.88017 type:complete len:412 (+) Transcript_35290:128-1363(+)